jgi:hypothetical protein
LTDLGSTLLAAAVFLALMAAVGAAVAALRPADQAARMLRVRGWATASGVAALALDLAAAVHHYRQGHGSGTAAALGPVDFVTAHPTLAVAAAVAAIAVAWARVSR